MENIAEGIRQSIHTKTRLKQVIINKGGAITDTTPFEEYPDILKQTKPKLQSKNVTPSEEVQVITADAGYDGLNKVTIDAVETADSGAPIEVATVEELEAVMTVDNIGKFYKYTGETTANYEQGAIYVVQDTEDPIVKDSTAGKPIPVDTAEEMTALLVEENIGKVYKYVGVTDDTYTNGQLYIVEEE